MNTIKSAIEYIKIFEREVSASNNVKFWLE